MRGAVSRWLAFAGLLWGSIALAAPATDPQEQWSDLLHSDVPLWVSGDHLWPMPFFDKDSWGCSSRFAFGDWQVTGAKEGSVSWLRLQNYGVFHCAYIVRRAKQREELERAEYHYGWLVMIGKIGVGASTGELWALQLGARPGSDYDLFAVDSQSGTIKAASELQRQCPDGHARGGKNVDIWATRYCSVNSQSDLNSIVHKMAMLPPLATIRYVGPVPEDPSLKP